MQRLRPTDHGESAQTLGTSLATAERGVKFSPAFLLRELGE
jgi:hypothetical protein